MKRINLSANKSDFLGNTIAMVAYDYSKLDCVEGIIMTATDDNTNIVFNIFVLSNREYINRIKYDINTYKELVEQVRGLSGDFTRRFIPNLYVSGKDKILKGAKIKVYSDVELPGTFYLGKKYSDVNCRELSYGEILFDRFGRLAAKKSNDYLRYNVNGSLININPALNIKARIKELIQH